MSIFRSILLCIFAKKKYFYGVPSYFYNIVGNYETGYKIVYDYDYPLYKLSYIDNVVENEKKKVKENMDFYVKKQTKKLLDLYLQKRHWKIKENVFAIYNIPLFKCRLLL